jgi:nitrogenase molybdenum-iron protein alpha/beta subunit
MNTLVIDDISHYETEKADRNLQTRHIFCARASRKNTWYKKTEYRLKQLHSYDYGGPYAGFEGAVNFLSRNRQDALHPIYGSYIEPALEKSRNP